MRWCLLIVCALLGACASSSQKDTEVLCATDWVSFDGKTMPWKSWGTPADQKPKAIVIAIHGLSGATSDFWPLGEHLSKHGIAVYAYELRGQGNDPDVAARGDIESARLWQKDLTTFHKLIKRRHPRVPVIWYGESLGSLIAAHTAANRPRWGDPDGIILASPVAGLRMTMSGFQRWLLEAAAAISPRTRYSLGDLAGVNEKDIQVTSTTTHGSQMAKTPHHISAFSLRLLTEIGQMMDANPDAAKRLKMPVLFLASPHDILSSADQIQGWFSQMRSEQKKLLWFTRSYHLLLHDVQREEVVRDVEAWLNKLSSRS
jgi:acylglycerol lipase